MDPRLVAVDNLEEGAVGRRVERHLGRQVPPPALFPGELALDGKLLVDDGLVLGLYPDVGLVPLFIRVDHGRREYPAVVAADAVHLAGGKKSKALRGFASRDGNCDGISKSA